MLPAWSIALLTSTLHVVGCPNFRLSVHDQGMCRTLEKVSRYSGFLADTFPCPSCHTCNMEVSVHDLAQRGYCRTLTVGVISAHQSARSKRTMLSPYSYRSIQLNIVSCSNLLTYILRYGSWQDCRKAWHRVEAMISVRAAGLSVPSLFENEAFSGTFSSRKLRAARKQWTFSHDSL